MITRSAAPWRVVAPAPSVADREAAGAPPTLARVLEAGLVYLTLLVTFAFFLTPSICLLLATRKFMVRASWSPRRVCIPK